MPDMTVPAKEQLLLYQVLTGLSHKVSKQLRATGTTRTLMETIERAKILMAVEKHVLATQVAAAQIMSTEFLQLQQQLTDLSS